MMIVDDVVLVIYVVKKLKECVIWLYYALIQANKWQARREQLYKLYECKIHPVEIIGYKLTTSLNGTS